MYAAKKALWTEALRSDKYKQTTGRLTTINERGDDEDCCLGVLCKVAIENGVDLAVVRNTVSGRVSYNEHFASLPYPVIQWAGLDSDDPDLGSDPASVWNDLEKASFKDIADLIDMHL